MAFLRLDRLTDAAKELSAATGRTCIPAQADVRDPKSLRNAVSKTIEKFGRIDFVICGAFLRLTLWAPHPLPFFPFVMCNRCSRKLFGSHIRPVRERFSNRDRNRHSTFLRINTLFTCSPIRQLGTFNTIKATIPYVRASRGSYIHVSATLHHNG